MTNGSTRLRRTTGVLAMLGGAAWVAAVLIHAAQPSGCVGDSCFDSPMRESTAATSWLVGLAGALLLVSGAGLLQVIRRHDGLGWTGRVGAGLCVLGIAVLALAVTLQALDADGDFTYMPHLVVPGMAGLALGAVLVGWTVVRSTAVPRWAGVALILGALLLVLANEQTDAVLLAIPFGLAWAATGVAVAASRASASDNRVSSVAGRP